MSTKAQGRDGAAAELVQEQGHRVVLQRREGFYSADNEMLDLAPELGVYAYSVYHLLKSEAWKGSPAMGLREIAETFRIGKDSAAKALRRLKELGLGMEIPSKSVNQPSTWVVVHAKDVMEQLEQQGRRPQVGTLRAKRKAKERVAGRVPIQGHTVSLGKDAGVLDQGRQRPQSGTRNKEGIQIPDLKTSAARGGRGKGKAPKGVAVGSAAAWAGVKSG